MDLEGRIIRKLNVQTGNSARGSWARQEFVIEFHDGNFPAQACFNVWGEDKVKDLEKYQVGDAVKISFNINSREYNGRWYNDLRAWRVEPAGASQQRPAAGQPQAASGNGQGQPAGGYAATAQTAPMPMMADMPAELGDSDEDLPF